MPEADPAEVFSFEAQKNYRTDSNRGCRISTSVENRYLGQRITGPLNRDQLTTSVGGGLENPDAAFFHNKKLRAGIALGKYNGSRIIAAQGDAFGNDRHFLIGQIVKQR